ncbi:MAG: patatin-like phospholipase family protein [Lutibacter sp.]|uniref:patatin-like phospholipase family protein n=1 Tax=Lutibacter sp. TaxID=1925666 RepID=UPI00385D97A6
MKALVISGGGSKGAFAGGVAEYLIKTQGKKYDIFVGTSVGSLLVSHLALNKINELKTIFSTITNQDVFNIYPFKVKEVNGEFNLKINHVNTVRAFIKGCGTFGESNNLRKLISRVFTPQDFEILKRTSNVTFTVSNLTLQKVEYKEAHECTYEDFCDWMWASANFVPFMSILHKNNCQYADGSFGSHISVLYAIGKGATEIDVIILDEDEKSTNTQIATNPFQSLMAVFKFMSNQSALKDILIGKLKGKQSKIDVKLWRPQEKLTDNPLFFNPVQMKSWWEKGYQYAKNNKPLCHCFLPNGEIKEM